MLRRLICGQLDIVKDINILGNDLTTKVFQRKVHALHEPIQNIHSVSQNPENIHQIPWLMIKPSLFLDGYKQPKPV